MIVGIDHDPQAANAQDGWHILSIQKPKRIGNAVCGSIVRNDSPWPPPMTLGCWALQKSGLHSLYGTLFGLVGTEAERAQNAPDMALAETYAVHALDECTHALERPQLGAKPMLG